MKKIVILCLTLVLALGALGIGYAAWTDQVDITGTVQTGKVCLSIERFKEYGECPDQNWTVWVYDGYSVSCPMGYHFEDIIDAPEGKCPATVAFTPHDTDGDGKYDALDVTINNAYPYFAADISFWVCNCGTIPIKVQAPVISQDPSLLIEYGDNIGRQLHVGQCVEISLFVGVTQHLHNNPAEPLTPQGVPLSFTIAIGGIQWNEYTP